MSDPVGPVEQLLLPVVKAEALDDGMEFGFLTMSMDGDEYVVAFSSIDQLREAAPPEENYISATRELLSGIGEQGKCVVIDPHSERVMEIPNQALRALSAAG